MLYIFDWDGTISDSTSKITACMQSAAIDVGLPVLARTEIKNIIGLGLPEALRFLYPSINDAEIEHMREAYSCQFKAADHVPSPFFPGAKKTMQSLLGQGHLLAIATGKSRSGLDRVLHRLELQNFFHFTRCADETASKPSPLMLHELLAESDVSVDEAVMIGDTEWDMCMAKNAGMKKIAVTYGAHEAERLEQCQPEMMVDSFTQILDWRF